MLAGRVAVGHPVDVATGTVYATYSDYALPGKVELKWQRRYSLSLLGMPPSPLGYGWTTPYFSSLTKDNENFLFVTPEGETEIFADPKGMVDRGGLVRNFGTFQELARLHNRYVVTRWDVNTSRIERYVFKETQPGTPGPLASIEDVTGQGLDLIYDKTDRLTAIQQRLEKRTLVLDYSPGNQISTLTFVSSNNHRHVLVRYEYDQHGNLIAAYDALERGDRYEYDSDSRMIREINKDGAVFFFKYDERGRCIRTSGSDRYDEKTFRYFDHIGWTEMTDSDGYVTRYRWNAAGQVVSQVSPLGGETRTGYDEHGRIVTTVDANGSKTEYEFDDSGNVTRIVNALGQVTEIIFNTSHLPQKITNPAGSTWEREYDAVNQLIATKDAEGNRWSLSYDGRGNLIGVVTARGDILRQSYSETGQLREVTDWEGHRTQLFYDMYGRLIKESDPLGTARSFEYDLLGNMIRIIYPDGSEIKCTYDNGGNLARVTDRKGHVTSYRFGPCGRLLAKTDPLGNTTTFRWGTEPGQLKTVINPKGEAYVFTHDAVGNITEEIGFDGRRLQFVHDLSGNRVAFVTGCDERIAYKRDPLGRLIETILADGSLMTFTYDEAGYLRSGTNPHIEVTFERDRNGRLRKEYQGDHFVEHEYDRLGSRVATKTSRGHETRYGFDGNGLLSRVTLNREHTFEISRNARGEEIQRILPGGIKLEQRVNEFGQVLEQRVGGQGKYQSTLIKRFYSYEKSDVATIEDDRWGRTELSYDAAEYLQRFVCEKGLRHQLTYDATGNLTSIFRNGAEERLVYGAGDRLLCMGEVSYEYDGHGRLVKKIGKETEVDEWRYGWNSLGQLCSVTKPDGTVWQYKYDAFGRRISKTGPHGEVHFIWDRDAIIHEITSNTLRRETRESSWVFNPHNLTPLAKLEGTKVFAVIVDQVGTPRELVDTETQEVVWAAHYGPFGEIHDVVGSVECPLRFQGQYYDQETGLCYNRFRFYDPATGRFISADPVRLAGGDNLYTYAPNVWNWIDPFGLASNAIYRGDDNYSGGPMGLPLGSDADIKDPKAHVTRPSKGETSVYTSFSEEHGNPEKGTGAYKFTKEDNVYKVKKSDLQTLADEGKIRIITHENVGEEMDRIGGFSEKDKKNVAANMKRNKEVLVAGEIPEEMITKCK